MRRFLRMIILLGSLALALGEVFATTRLGGLTLEEVSEAPWIFLGEVVFVETLTDGITPLNFSQKWQARYTRFRVIHSVKGPFYKGNEVELKECAENDLPGQPFCGSLYPSAPVSKMGERFLIVTGPGNPNVYNYQTSIRFPAQQVPIVRHEPLALEGAVSAPMEWIPESESGWLVDLSRLSQKPKTETPHAASSSPAGSKQKMQAPMGSTGKGLSLKRGWADLNELAHELSGKPVEK